MGTLRKVALAISPAPRRSVGNAAPTCGSWPRCERRPRRTPAAERTHPLGVVQRMSRGPSAHVHFGSARRAQGPRARRSAPQAPGDLSGTPNRCDRPYGGGEGAVGGAGGIAHEEQMKAIGVMGLNRELPPSSRSVPRKIGAKTV